jgi:hypothetical protein
MMGMQGAKLKRLTSRPISIVFSEKLTAWAIYNAKM